MRVQSQHLGIFVPASYYVPEMPVVGTDWPPVTWQHGMGRLADFVDANYDLPEMPVAGTDWPPVTWQHGMGRLAEFVGGQFAVPENPVSLAGLADFVTGRYALPENPVVFDGIGDLVGTGPMYPLHDNSVLEEAARLGMSGLGMGKDCGCGCNGHGSCGDACGGGLSGIADDMSAFFSGQMSKIAAGDVVTIAMWAGGALLIGMFLFGRSGTSRAGYRTARSMAKEDRKIRESTARKSYQEAIRAARAQYPTGAQRLGRAARAGRAAF